MCLAPYVALAIFIVVFALATVGSVAALQHVANWTEPAASATSFAVGLVVASLVAVGFERSHR